MRSRRLVTKMGAININKIAWFEKQLQHKTGVEALKLTPAIDGYLLTLESSFVLENYAPGFPAACSVSMDAEALHFADIEQGVHYRLQVNGQVVLFKITTRKIWFFDSLRALVADVKRN